MKKRIPILLLTALLMTACGGKSDGSSSEESFSASEQSSETSTQIESSSISEQSSSEEQSSSSESHESSETSSVSESSSEEQSSSEQSSSDQSSSSEEIVSNFVLSTDDGAFTQEGNIYTITAAGTYTATGDLKGQIIVSATSSDNVTIELSGANIEFDSNSPILCLSANKVEISAKKNTTNSVTDNRSEKTVDDDAQGEGAISAKCDLKLKGAGSLEVIGHYNNGVHTSDDLDIQKLTIKSSAVNNAFKGKDNLTINSGTITAIAGSNAFKTDNTDVSSKGNQRGIITVLDGTINAYSAYDAFDASYNVDIQGGTINVLTNKYAADYIDIDTEISKTYLYMRTSAVYSSSYRYFCP